MRSRSFPSHLYTPQEFGQSSMVVFIPPALAKLLQVEFGRDRRCPGFKLALERNGAEGADRRRHGGLDEVGDRDVAHQRILEVGMDPCQLIDDALGAVTQSAVAAAVCQQPERDEIAAKQPAVPDQIAIDDEAALQQLVAGVQRRKTFLAIGDHFTGLGKN